MAAAYLLVAHGSRDPRPQQALAALCERLTQELGCPVGWAMLEFGRLPLGGRIVEFIAEHAIERLSIAPFFLSSGVHVCDDIPEQLAVARSKLASGPASPTIEVLFHAGRTIDFARAVADRLARRTQPEAVVAIAHGSRRPGGNAEVERFGERIRAAIGVPFRLAYWSREGDIASALDACVADGHKRLTIVPHFLFPGRLTDAIAEQIAASALDATLLPTWSEDTEWATRAVLDWLRDRAPAVPEPSIAGQP